jgi:5-oxoprolinase (ATP-hydrolysing) subunit C
MMTILKAAVQSSVQDLGRHGFHHLGVGASGAMDRLSLVIGNYLVGNACDAAGLELCMPPARIRLDAACAIALTGADCSARLDDTAVDVGRRVLVEAGQTLDLSAAHAGIRAYLCLSGGIDVPQVLGSRSTDLQAGMGGLEGRVLRRGDVLQLTPSAIPERAAAGVLLPRMGNSIRILPGPEFDGFAPEARDALLKASWTVTAQSNRMGYRLAGPALIRKEGEELKSHAVFPGVIQVPHGGAPIVLMAEAQVTGGYPKIAAVIAADQWRLAQIPPGGPIQFAACTRAQALLAWQKQQYYLQRMQRGLHAH